MNMHKVSQGYSYWLYWGMVLIVVTSVLVLSIISPGIDGYDRARLGDMVYGEAH
jgi:hypothetical protein